MTQDQHLQRRGARRGRALRRRLPEQRVDLRKVDRAVLVKQVLIASQPEVRDGLHAVALSILVIWSGGAPVRGMEGPQGSPIVRGDSPSCHET